MLRRVDVALLVLWVAIGADALFSLIPLAIPHLVATVVTLLAELTFALVHGARIYRWTGILTFLVITLVVSNVFEDVGVLVGAPFGHYHYSDSLGVKLFQVPVLIGPAYFTVGYMAWILASILMRPVHRRAPMTTVIGTPVIASFVMVAWDLALDPSASTLEDHWIWEHGGGFFGVPLSNFLGWSLTAYVFYQIFALYVHYRGPEPRQFLDQGRTYWYSAVAAYLVVAAPFITEWMTGDQNGMARVVTDAAGRQWHSFDVHEASAVSAIYGMGFITVLAALRLRTGAQTLIHPARTPSVEPAPGTQLERSRK